MKKVTVSAPGKLHLSGEHAVVHGNPAIIIATSLRLFVTLEKQSGGKRLSDFRKEDAYINAIVEEFEKKHGTKTDNGIGIDVQSTIPQGNGMGSSAALAVATAGALAVWHGFPWNTAVINEIAYQAEKVKHANSSGSDPAVATHGGILWYRKELEFLKTLWLLPFKIPKTFAPFVLINTGRTESTGELVTHVASVRKRNEKRFLLLLSDMEDVTRRMAAAIHDEDEVLFRAAVTQNQRHLESMEVVSESAETLIRKVETSGGVAKVSGAGGLKTGSGVVISIHDTPSVLTELAKAQNYPAFLVQLGGEGVKLEQALT